MNVSRELLTQSLSPFNSLQANNSIWSGKQALLALSQDSFSSHCSALTHSKTLITSQEFVTGLVCRSPQPPLGYSWLMGSDTPHFTVEGSDRLFANSICLERGAMGKPYQTQRALPGEIAGDIANWGLREDGSEAKPRYYKDGVHLYRFDANGRTYQGIEYAKETILVIHGWKNSSEDEIFSNLQRELAKQNPSKQILALDWRDPANHDGDRGLQPNYTSGSVAPVAQWAARTLNSLEITGQQLSLVGFSLGAYVAAEIGFLLGKVAHLTALDPAYEASTYDIDGNNFGNQRPKPFGDVAYQSLAVVVSDESGGFAGDNNHAATANNSFLLRFRGDNWNEYDRNVKYHSAVVEVYTDFISRDRTLPAFESNRFNNNAGYGSIHEGCFNISRRDGRWYEDGFDYFSGSTQLGRWV